MIVGTAPNERFNREAAEQALIASGHCLNGNRLRFHLINLCKEMSQDLYKRRSSMTDKDPVGQAESLERSVKGRMPSHERAVKKFFAKSYLGFVGLVDNAIKPSAITRFATFFSPIAIKQLVEQSDANTLVQSFNKGAELQVWVIGLFRILYGNLTPDAFPGLALSPFATLLLGAFVPSQPKNIRRKRPYPFDEIRLGYYSKLVVLILVLSIDKQRDGLHESLVEGVLEFSRLFMPTLSIPKAAVGVVRGVVNEVFDRLAPTNATPATAPASLKLRLR